MRSSFLLIPHIVRTQDLQPVNLRTIDTGQGQSIELRHTPGDTPITIPTAPAKQAAPARSTVGTVPGQTAESAAPAALAQLRAAADASGDAATKANSAGWQPAPSGSFATGEFLPSIRRPVRWP